MELYGIPILGVDTHWTDTSDGPTDPYVTVHVSTPHGERRVTVRQSSDRRGIDWTVSSSAHLPEAHGHAPEPDYIADNGLADIAFMEAAFDVVCAAFYGDYESLNGEVESSLGAPTGQTAPQAA